MNLLYHSKGLFIKEKGKSVDQFFGSSNFNARGAYIDTESNATITTFDEDMLKRIDDEVAKLMQHGVRELDDAFKSGNY